MSIGKATLSVASATTAEGNAQSLGAGLPFEGHHRFSRSCAGDGQSSRGKDLWGLRQSELRFTVYGQARADIVLGKRMTLHGSVTDGRRSFWNTGFIAASRTDALAMALG